MSSDDENKVKILKSFEPSHRQNYSTKIWKLDKIWRNFSDEIESTHTS